MGVTNRTPSNVTRRSTVGSNSPHHDRRWLILAVIGIAQLMVVLDVTIVNIALPSAQQDLGFSDDDRQWVITAYALAFGSLLLLGGRIADLFGRKWTFIAGLLGFAGASAAGGAAQSFETLVAARALQGVFAAMLAPAALSLLATTFTEPAERGKAFGIYAAIAGMGGAIGLLLGGALTEALDWRYCLYVSIAFAVPAAIAGTRLLHHVPAPARPRLDVPRHADRVERAVRARVRPLARRHRRLGRPRHDRLSRRQRRPARHVRRDPAARRPPAAAAAGRRRPQPRRVVPGDRNRERRALRPLPVPDVLPAEHEGPDRTRDRPRVPAAELLDRPHDRHRQHPRAPAHRPAPPGAGGAAHRRAGHGAADAHRRGHGVRVARPALADPDRCRLRADAGPVVRDRHVRRAGARRGRRLGDGQHLPADRRLDRDRTAEHAGGVRDDRLRHGPRAGARGAAPGRGARLHHRVLVGRGDLRRRRARVRQHAAIRREVRDRPRRRAGTRACAHVTTEARGRLLQPRR